MICALIWVNFDTGQRDVHLPPEPVAD